jgi:hypothetical protein
MEAHVGIGRVELKIERRRLHRLLLVAGEARETVGESVGDPEFHGNSLPPPHPEERRRRRRVSKDAPERTNGASFWIILRHAMLRIAAQDEG